MKITFKQFENHRMAYIRHIGPYGPSNIETMNRLKAWASENGLLNHNAVILGITQDHPEVTPPRDCRYDACILLTDDIVLDESISEGILPCGEYAVYQIEHTAEALQQAYIDISPLLLRKNYQIDNRPIIERYAMEMVANHYCELCVPIKRH